MGDRTSVLWLAAAVLLSGPGCTAEVTSGLSDRGPGASGADGGGAGTPTTPDGKPRVSGGCLITGCNDQLCSDRRVTTECQPTPQDACFANGICERGDSGSCRWRPTTELHACLAGAAGMQAPDAGPDPGRGSGSGIASDGGVGGGGGGGAGGGGGGGDCRQTGCFGELCADRDLSGGSCDWRNEYACYISLECERQSSGACGWTSTDWLDTCVAIAGGGFGF